MIEEISQVLDCDDEEESNDGRLEDGISVNKGIYSVSICTTRTTSALIFNLSQLINIVAPVAKGYKDENEQNCC